MEKFVASNEAFKQEMRQHIQDDDDHEEEEEGYDQHEGDGEEVFEITDEMAPEQCEEMGDSSQEEGESWDVRQGLQIKNMDQQSQMIRRGV